MNKVLQKKSEEICKDILKLINNETVNVEIDEESKSSLYVFLTNTMYISNKTKKSKSIDEQNKSKVLVIAHECAHSLQSKVLQLMNFLLANLEIILFVAVVITRIFFSKFNLLVNSYLAISVLSIVMRWCLEMDATINSVKITTKYMLKNNVDKVKVKELFKFYKKELLKTLPLFLLWVFLFKIIRLIIVILI